MKTKAAVRSFCLVGVPGLLISSAGCDAFVNLNTPHAPSRQHRHHTRPGAATPTRSLQALPQPRIPSAEDVSAGGQTGRVARRSRNRGRCTAAVQMAAGSGESANGQHAYSPPTGPGAGVINLQFRHLKAGGFKVFLLLFLLGVS